MNLRSWPVIALAFATTFTACKKDNTPVQKPDPAPEVQAHAEDQNRISTNLDDLTTEINFALETTPTFSGRIQNGQNTTNVCNVSTAVDTANNTWKITLTYNGADCFGTHFRTGTIVISTPAGTRWKNAGAAVTATLQNFKVKRLSDNKSITFNGSQVFTNVSGGLLLNLSNLQEITHTVVSNNMSVTFDDNTQRAWNVARKRVFSFNNGIVMTIHGIGTNGAITNAAEWGINRFAHPFTTSITQPLVFRQDCSGRLTAGQIKHQGFATSTATFGLNASGNPATCPGSGNYYYKLTWTGPAGNSLSTILPY